MKAFRFIPPRVLRFALASPLLVLSVGGARADVVLLRNGRTLSVTDYRKDGDRIRLVMEGGGEIALPTGQVIAIRREPAPAAPVERPPSPAPAAPSPGRSESLGPGPLEIAAPAAQVDAEGPIEIAPGVVFDRGALRD